MSQLLKAVYQKGAFVPTEPCDLAEGAEAIVIVGDAAAHEPQITDAAERKRALARLVERMRNRPLPLDAPHLSRDEMHERR